MGQDATQCEGCGRGRGGPLTRHDQTKPSQAQVFFVQNSKNSCLTNLAIRRPCLRKDLSNRKSISSGTLYMT